MWGGVLVCAMNIAFVCLKIQRIIALIASAFLKMAVSLIPFWVIQTGSPKPENCFCFMCSPWQTLVLDFWTSVFCTTLWREHSPPGYCLSFWRRRCCDPTAQQEGRVHVQSQSPERCKDASLLPRSLHIWKARRALPWNDESGAIWWGLPLLTEEPGQLSEFGINCR